MQLVPITLKEQYQIDLLTRLTSRHLSHAEKDSLTRPDGKSFLQRLGSVAEWSKALVLGTSHFGGVGSNPTTIKLLNQLSGVRIRQSRIKNQFYYFLDFHLYWNERSTLVIMLMAQWIVRLFWNIRSVVRTSGGSQNLQNIF